MGIDRGKSFYWDALPGCRDQTKGVFREASSLHQAVCSSHQDFDHAPNVMEKCMPWPVSEAIWESQHLYDQIDM